MTGIDLVLQMLRDGSWLTPGELQRGMREGSGVMMADAAITARIRDLRKEKYGGWDTPGRRRKGCKSFEYTIVLEPQRDLF
jgi:hypothetical protein